MIFPFTSQQNAASIDQEEQERLKRSQAENFAKPLPADYLKKRVQAAFGEAKQNLQSDAQRKKDELYAPLLQTVAYMLDFWNAQGGLHASVASLSFHASRMQLKSRGEERFDDIRVHKNAPNIRVYFHFTCDAAVDMDHPLRAQHEHRKDTISAAFCVFYGGIDDLRIRVASFNSYSHDYDTYIPDSYDGRFMMMDKIANAFEDRARKLAEERRNLDIIAQHMSQEGKSKMRQGRPRKKLTL